MNQKVTREDLNAAYTVLCQKLGHAVYVAEKLRADIDKVQAQANELAVQDAKIDEAMRARDAERIAAIQAAEKEDAAKRAMAEAHRRTALAEAATQIMDEQASVLEKLAD